MPLTVLLTLVILGIAGIAALTWALGMGSRATIPDTEALRAIWDADNPDMPATDATLSAGGNAGLIETTRGLGLVWPMGADFATRSLAGAQLHATRRGYVMHLPDYTAPRIRLDLTEAEATEWVARMEAGSAWQTR